MRAISVLIREVGRSTRVCFAVTAFRILAIMSAIGSVIAPTFSAISPTTFRDARDVPFERQLSEAEPAQRELAHVRARAAAQTATVPQPDLVLRRFLLFRDLGSSSHINSSQL